MPSHRGRTVLVVDDDPSILLLMKRSLERLDYQVLTAEDRSEAESILRTAAIDAMILDLHLKSESGLDVLDYVRANAACAAMPVLILTGTTQLTEATEETIRRHRAYVFYKPASITEFNATLSRELHALR
jgi:DNA-binding response OmpR family regulator